MNKLTVVLDDFEKTQTNLKNHHNIDAINALGEAIKEEMEKKYNNKDQTQKTAKGSGMRYNSGKLRYDLVHPKAHEDMVKVLTYGANKYTLRDDDGNITYDGSMNWRKGLSWMSVIASLKRHLAAFEAGEDYDPESGELHIAHAACNIHFLNAFHYIFPQGDDRPKRFLNLPKIGLDIDCVLADFVKAWSDLFDDVSSEPLSWYMDRNMKERFAEMDKNGELEDFYLHIPPLIKPEDIPFEPHCYITSRPVNGGITEKWLDKHGFPRRKVYTVGLMQSKVEVAKEAGVEIFVDDSFDNFVDLNNNNIFTYLYDAPWNRKFDVGHMRLNSLKDLKFN